MNEKLDHDFLEPLKSRPGLSPRKEFKRELRNKLRREEDSSSIRGWIPNMVAAVLILIVGYFTFELLMNQNGITEQNALQQYPDSKGVGLDDDNDNKDSPVSPVELNEETAQQLLGEAFAHYSVVVNGGGPEMGEAFSYKGKQYRYLGTDFDTKEKVIDYLIEKFTKERAEAILEMHSFVNIDGKLAQPDEDFSGSYLWQDSTAIKIINPKGDTYVTYEVPIENGNKETEVFDISLKYVDGWKINGLIPFSPDEEQKDDAEEPADFSLTEEEMTVYQAFSKDPTEAHLKKMEPVSLAKIYVQALLDNRQDLVYEMYTDRPEYIRWTKKEHEEIPSSDLETKEIVLKAFKGIEKGEFIQKDDIHGYISFDNGGEGKMGFQMVKDEDGYWSVAFMPTQ